MQPRSRWLLASGFVLLASVLLAQPVAAQPQTNFTEAETRLLKEAFQQTEAGTSPQRTIALFQQVLAIARKYKLQPLEASALFRIGSSYTAIGQPKQALSYLTQALSLFRVLGKRSEEATTLNNIGLAYDGLGQPQPALENYQQAFSLFRDLSDRRGQVSALNNIGDSYRITGQFAKALAHYQQVLTLLQNVDDRASLAIILTNLGEVYREAGQLPAAQAALNRALPLHRQVNNPAGEAATLNNLGLAEQSKGELQAALEHFNQALPIVRQLGDRVSEAKALSNIGTVYTALGQPQIALDVFNQALPIFRQVGDRLGEATTLSSRAATYQTMNQLTPAITDWEQALKITLAVRQGLTRDNRQHFLQTSTGRISSLISLLIDQNQPDRAYEWANLATTADLADYSRLVNARVANSSAQQAIDQWNQHNQQLQQLRQRLQEPGLFSEPLSQQVRELERQVYQEAEAIARRFPEVAELFETTPTDIAQLQASIPAGTTVIQPVLLTPARNMPASVALFVLSKDTLSVVKQPIDPAEFETLLINTYQQLTNRWDDTYPDNLAKLHDLLIRPISAQLQATIDSAIK